jgi:hypothetical protein
MADEAALEVALQRFEGRYREAVRRGAAACPFGLEAAAQCPGLGMACPSGSCAERASWTPEQRAAFDQADDELFAEEACLRGVDWPAPDLLERAAEAAPPPPRPCTARVFPVGRGGTLPDSVREEILELRRAGLTYPAIAARLGVGRTTAWHVARQAEGAAA